MKKIAVLGSTGSIGVNTLDVIELNPDRFELVAMAAGSNVDLFAEQIHKFRPRLVSLHDASRESALRQRVNGLDVEILTGQAGSIAVARLAEVDLLVCGMVGCAGLVPSYAAVQAGKTLALANKETLVVAGEVILQEAERTGATIIPVDSEHSAIFQVLNGEDRRRVKRIILTASGGPFRTWTAEQMERVTVEEALRHPNWSMGDKITIDSATMMNKGLEYIEAKWLFGVEVPVEIIVHAQSVIHSMIEFVDTSIIAQLGIPDMRVPIAYALTHPDRVACDLKSLDLAAMAQLTFEPPDFDRFPCLKLAHDVMDAGQTLPAVLNAANEVAVQAFLDRLIPFKDIAEIIRGALEEHSPHTPGGIDDLLAADRWARETARRLITVTH
ncbi:MAG: 1-deoxy-D-xylulose-5-phosphate reductoisomerase [Nitrospinaceae bacterium]